MAAQTATLVNGIVPHPPKVINEALEYEKILKLRDEVFAGSYHRLSVPAHALRNFSPRLSQLTTQASLAIPTTFPTSTTLAQPSTQQQSDDRHSPAVMGASLSTPQPPASVSEFNPVLLTKSDDLLRAEIALKRQRLEKTLRDQFEQKRLDSRKKPAPAEAKPDFDAAALLAKALESTKSTTAKVDSASDSFDENSFYSSRAPDSTPERGAPSPSPADEDELAADAASGQRVQSAVMGAPLNADADDDGYAPPEPANVEMSGIDDDEEEGEYSPPEALEQEIAAFDASPSNMQDGRDPRGRPLRRYSEVDEGGNMRIVRNHIITPAAPQPSRVSPLTFAKDGLIQNNRGRRPLPQQGGSPEFANQGGPARKKRKMDKKHQRTRRNGMSPDVKDENVSPPPFHKIQPLGSGKLRPTNADRPIVIDDGQDYRYEQPGDRYLDSPTRPMSRQIEPIMPIMPLSEPRTSSRSGMRVMRDDQDLRRVASMHNMRAEQPREYVERIYDSSPTQNRAYRESSPMVVDRPHMVDDGYDRQPLQEVRVSRTPAPVYREVYQEPQVRYEPMPPPPIERIVVDQYGRRFREIIQQERPSVAPRAMSVRPSEIEPAYETYRGSRAGSVFVDAPPERRYTQDMPPPPANYRQLAEPPRAGGGALTSPRDAFDQLAMPRSSSIAQPRDTYEQPSMMRSSSMAVPDRATRQPVYIDERTEYREPPRTASVRPIAPQYEGVQPREPAMRGSSVRPAGREGNVVLDEFGRRREYLPVEQPRYRVMEQEEPRYVDAQGREVTMQRSVQRY